MGSFFNYSRMGPKTLLRLLRPLYYIGLGFKVYRVGGLRPKGLGLGPLWVVLVGGSIRLTLAVLRVQGLGFAVRGLP